MRKIDEVRYSTKDDTGYKRYHVYPAKATSNIVRIVRNLQRGKRKTQNSKNQCDIMYIKAKNQNSLACECKTLRKAGARGRGYPRIRQKWSREVRPEGIRPQTK